MKFVCVGDCGVDVYEPSGDVVIGGIAANVARNLKEILPASDSVGVVSCVGDDEYAEAVISDLVARGVDCDISTANGRTPRQLIRIESDGERTFTGYDEGVLRDFEIQARQRETIASADVLALPVFVQIVDLFDRLMAIDARATVAVDFADFAERADFDLLQRYIDRIDACFFGLTAEHADVITRLAQLACDSNAIFVVTLGAGGSIALHGDEEYRCPAVQVEKVVDTTGAGDAFAAGFLAAHTKRAPLQKCLESGARRAATVVQHFGAVSATGNSPEKDP